MFIPIILGTARTGRNSLLPAKYILDQVTKAGLETQLLDVKDNRLEATDNSLNSPISKEYAKIIDRADGLIIVSPEYNHGYPGELKMMLDMAYKEYFHKPVGICGVSIGILGGARMVEQLRLVCIELHMIPLREAIYFPKVQDLFDSQGLIKDNTYTARVKTFLDELKMYAEALKAARNKGSIQ